MVMIYFSFSLKDYLEKNDSTSESVVWEFLVDLSLVSIIQIDEECFSRVTCYRSGNDRGGNKFFKVREESWNFISGKIDILKKHQGK